MNNNQIDWSTLGFGYVPTDYNVRCYYRDGKWGEIEISSSETIEMHIAATALHYGQEIFEGLKAFRGKDGKVRVFRPMENCKRIQDSARGIMMQPITDDKFAFSAPKKTPDASANRPAASRWQKSLKSSS